jgi:hypothetical protein
MRDAQGHELSGETIEAVGYFDSAVRAFALIYGDASGFYGAALKASPQLVMAYLGKAWPLVLANDPQMAASAHSQLNMARDLPMNERERTHLAALSHAVVGHRASAVAILDRHLMSHPFDLVAHMAALQMDGHLGRFPWARDRSARALPRWSKAQEGYGIMQSFYGFGLEEAGEYTRAEDTARASLSRSATGRTIASLTSWR